MNNFKIFTFNNGFKYLTSKNTGVKHCILLILLGTGSVCETEKLAGISHFLEHMPFKGTKKYRTAAKLSFSCDSLGSETNAFTDREMTGYYIKLSKNASLKGLDIIADIVLNPRLLEKDIQQERGVILEEYDKGLDEQDNIVDEMVHETLFRGHPLANSIIGTRKTINNISGDDLREYYKKHYLPSNMNLIVIGNYPNKIHDNIKNLFNIPCPIAYQRLEQSNVIYNTSKRIVFKENKDLEQTCISIVFPTVDYNNTDKYILDLIGTCLGDGMSARLFIELREKHSLVYNISADQDSYHRGGYFEISTCLKHYNIEKTIRLVLAEINKIKKYGIAKKELNKCKNYIKGNIVISSEDLSDIAEFYAYQLIYADKVINYNTYFKHINKITTKDIIRVVKKYLDTSKASVFIYGKIGRKQMSNIGKMLTK